MCGKVSLYFRTIPRIFCGKLLESRFYVCAKVVQRAVFSKQSVQVVHKNMVYVTLPRAYVCESRARHSVFRKQFVTLLSIKF